MSGRELGRLAGWHAPKVSRIEYAHRPPSTHDVGAWCQHCGVPEQAEDLIASLEAIEGMFVEWRHMERTGLRHAQESVLPLWERARRFRFYAPNLIPGPLQTRAYITAVLTAFQQRRDLPDDVEDAVQVRVDKQQVLHQPIGGPNVMTGQLGHLLTVSTLSSVSLGIIPLGANRSNRCPPKRSSYSTTRR
ncbi:Scr1 family TA system antitoxin-like transcriptional regulator [Nonomuraea angiospora]